MTGYESENEIEARAWSPVKHTAHIVQHEFIYFFFHISVLHANGLEGHASAPSKRARTGAARPLARGRRARNRGALGASRARVEPGCASGRAYTHRHFELRQRQ